MSDMREHFLAVADTLDGLLGADELSLSWYRAERSDFARLNGAQVRQAGRVSQQRVSLRLVHRRRHAGATLDLAGSFRDDRDRLTDTVGALRARLALAEPDPHLLYDDTPVQSDDRRDGSLPALPDVLAQVIEAAGDLDLVGIWAAGDTACGFASSTGARRWHQRQSFHLDWSLHAGPDSALKNSLAGEHWDEAALNTAMLADRERFALLRTPARSTPPGRYRAFLAPAALGELLGLLAWGGFGLRAQRTGVSALASLARGERHLSEAVSLREQPGQGLAPPFTADGFELPGEVMLVERGGFASALVSPRSAREYDATTNSADEVPQALVMDAGTLEHSDIPALIGNGIEIANLWYCNYADRNECRMTGMTRFACFVVEDGRRVAPLAAMRFDDSLYGLLGTRLAGLTRERRLLADGGTYGERSLAGMLLPGALVEDLRLVL